MRRDVAALSFIFALHALPALAANSGDGTTLSGQSEATL